MPVNDIGMCVLIQPCFYTSAVIYLLMYFTFHRFMYVCYACYHFHRPVTLSNPPSSC